MNQDKTNVVVQVYKDDLQILVECDTDNENVGGSVTGIDPNIKLVDFPELFKEHTGLVYENCKVKWEFISGNAFN